MASHDVAAALRALADQLEAGEGLPPGPGLASRALLEHLPSAEHIPSPPWASVSERALGKSLRTLRTEALHAVSAFHAAHMAASEVLRGRVIQGYVRLKRGRDPGMDPEQTHVEQMQWNRDEMALHQALQTVSQVEVPDLCLSEALRLGRDEFSLAESVVDHMERALARGLLGEQEEEEEDTEEEQ